MPSKNPEVNSRNAHKFYSKWVATNMDRLGLTEYDVQFPKKAYLRSYWSNNRERFRTSLARKKENGLPDVAKILGRTKPSECEVCGRDGDGHSKMHLDHCHATGQLRGWLCGNCNRALGMIKDSPETARALATYLEHNGPTEEPSFAELNSVLDRMEHLVRVQV